MSEDYDKIVLNVDKLKLCHKFARNCCIGGKSNIRNKRDRSNNLVIDNFIGQVGTLAGSIYLLGESRGILEYVKARKKADRNPFIGDGGEDLMGYNIDIKCSYMRRSKNPNSYNFLIRPRERHCNWVYLQTLADKTGKNEITVYMVGWISDKELPKDTESCGIFKGAFKLPVKQLKQFPIKQQLLINNL